MNKFAFIDDTPEMLCKRAGFKYESHNIVTPDGWHLKAHRIPRPGAPPVILQHGSHQSSSIWIINEQKHSIAFRLSFDGYDVWMVNNRGNIWSRYNDKHEETSKEYWDFDEEQYGTIDNVEEINYILRVTAE